jgi:uncharacterized protein (DUF885 family)
MTKNFILFSIFLIGLFSCGEKKSNNNATLADSQEVKQICENYYQERLPLYPFEATSQGDTRYNDQFPIEISEAHRAKLGIFYKKYQAELAKLDATKLNANDKMSYDILKWECDINLESLTFPEHLMPINQFDCKTLMLPQQGSGAGSQPFKTPKDYDDWLKRMSVIPAWADTAIANMKRGVAAGWVLPKSLASKVLPQLKEVAAPVAKNIFYTPITQLPKDFSAEDKKRLTIAYTDAINQWINPSYQKLYDFFQKEYLPACRSTSGVGALPNGKAYYEHTAKLWTTTKMSPDEIFALGESEVARIRTEMEKVKEQVGFKGDLKAFFNHVNNLPALHPFKTDQAVIDNFSKIHDKMKPQLAKLFDLVPKTPFQIKQTEAFREASASAEYMQGSPDGTRPGTFYCPVLDAKDYNVFQDEALFLHEAIPGHHYQCSLQQENEKLPSFRRFLWYGAYGEGWALYTESLGKELGLYDDPYQYFGRLGMEMHRAIRLVVDVGMHYKGWTREQAIQYSLDNEAETEGNTIAEVERYMANQGQALSYKIGQLKIRQLRTQAEQKMGAKFDIKAFHNETLKYGCLPLNVYEQAMQKWMGQ